MPMPAAVRKAQDMGLDLILIAPTAEPPRYEERRIERAARPLARGERSMGLCAAALGVVSEILVSRPVIENSVVLTGGQPIAVEAKP